LDTASGPPRAPETAAPERVARVRPLRPGLDMLELGLDEVRRMWDERFGRDVYAVFSAFVDVDYPTFVSFMTSVLPGLNEEFMVDHIRRLAEEGPYDRIVWDTAPLGQTLALLETPALLGEHLRMAPRIYSRLRTSGEGRESILEVLRRWQALAEACMDFLRERVDFTMVTIAEALAVDQLEGVFAEMRRRGLEVRRLVVNNVVRTTDSEFLRRRTSGSGSCRCFRTSSGAWTACGRPRESCFRSGRSPLAQGSERGRQRGLAPVASAVSDLSPDPAAIRLISASVSWGSSGG